MKAFKTDVSNSSKMIHDVALTEEYIYLGICHHHIDPIYCSGIAKWDDKVRIYSGRMECLKSSLNLG